MNTKFLQKIKPFVRLLAAAPLLMTAMVADAQAPSGLDAKSFKSIGM